MVHLKSLKQDAKVYDTFATRAETYGPFIEACEKIMRSPSSLSAGQRELLGTYVSALNACPYCHDVHNEAVKAHGFDGELTQQLKQDIASAPVDENMKPVFALAKKITENAYKVTQSDFDRLADAGWDDDAIFDVVAVTCLFNFMNRFVSAMGIEADDDYLAEAGERLKNQGYNSSLEKELVD